MDKRFWAIIGVIVVVFFSVVLLRGNNNKSSNTSSSTKPTNHVTGNLSSAVTLTEYGDYECPACESFDQTVLAVRQKYATTIKFQFRNLPLSQVHPNAFAGARAAEAADMQGKFWEMHDALYQNANWSDWSTATDPTPFFKTYAKQLGLDATKFQNDFKSSAANDRVNADIAAFKATGKDQSTPTFFLNGKYIANTSLLDGNNLPSIDAFSKVIDAALAANK